jgi:hypothetical protein
MAKRIIWWQAAEIIRISCRDAAAGAAADGAASLAAVPGEVFRFQRAPLSREAARVKRHSAQQNADILTLQPQCLSKSLTRAVNVA